MAEEATNRTTQRKIREGVVVSTKMDKTVVVAVIDRVRHPRYGKTMQRTSHLYAHDEANDAHEGDRVRIAETRPLSKLKHWYFFPAIGVTSANNIAVTFADSAKKTFPQLMAAAGPIAGGAFSSVILVKAGTSANLTTRYGDYFAVAVDPAATTNVWVAGEIGGPSTGAWQTAVAQVIIT